MELAMVGLGRMGANMAERLVRGGHRVVGSDPSAEARDRKSTRLNSSHMSESRMPSSA